MTVVLENVTRVVGALPYISDVSLTFEPGTLSVLLGPTLVGQDLADAPAGRSRSANHGARRRERQERDGRRRPQAFGGDGLPAIRQLPLLHRLREHRLALAGAGPAQRGGRAAGRRGRQPAAAGALSRPHAARSVGRPAAAHRDRPRPGQGRRSRAARRAAGQSRLQAARGTAHRAAAHLRGVRRHLRLRHHRALGGAAAGRPDDLPVGGPRRCRSAARRASTAGPTVSGWRSCFPIRRSIRWASRRRTAR